MAGTDLAVIGAFDRASLPKTDRTRYPGATRTRLVDPDHMRAHAPPTTKNSYGASGRAGHVVGRQYRSLAEGSRAFASNPRVRVGRGDAIRLALRRRRIHCACSAVSR